MSYGPTTAASLLTRVRDPSDQAAWREFDERYRALLTRFCCRRNLARADAEDVVQRVFANLSRSLASFTYQPQRGRFRDYLFRCTRNAIAEWRRRPERRDRPLFTDGQSEFSEHAVAPASEEETRLWEDEWVAHHYRMALETVRRTFNHRSVEVFDRLIHGDSPRAIASEMGMTDDAIYKIQQRVRQRMEELIAEQITEEDAIG